MPKVKEKPCILVVDSTENSKEFWVEFLSKFDVTVASNYEDAIEFYENSFLRISSILLEFQFSKSCLDTVLKLKNINNNINIIAFSKEKNIKIAVAALKAGTYEFIHLPCTKEKINKLVSESVRNALGFTSGILDNVNRSEISTSEILVDYILKQEKLMEKNFKGKYVSKEIIRSLFQIKDQTSTEKKHKEFETQVTSVARELPDLGILIFDDIPEYQNQVKDILVGKFSFFVASHFDDAREILKKHPSIQCCILNLLSEDSLLKNVLSLIRKEFPSIYVIVSAPNDYFKTVLLSFQEGACNYIEVPYVKTETLQVLQECVDLFFKDNVLSEFRPLMVEKFIPEKEKMMVLTTVNIKKKEEGNYVLMKDIYTLFPKLKATFIPEDVSIPFEIIENRLDGFIAKLEEQSKLIGAKKEV